MYLRWFSILAPLLLCSSCFRAANVDPNEVQQLAVEQGSATIVYKNGDSLRIADFDSITVQATRVEPYSTEEQSEFEFDRTTRGSLAAPLLELEDQRRRRAFPISQVQNISLERYSPERPWLILAAASVGAVAGGMLGYAMGGPCNDEWGCMEKGLYAIAGAPIGFGVGLAVGFPLTRSLGTFYPAPNGAKASTE